MGGDALVASLDDEEFGGWRSCENFSLRFFLGFKKKYHMKNFMNKPLTSNLEG